MTDDIIKDIRQLGMLSILQKVMMGETIEKACEGTNYSERTFRRMLQEDKTVAKELIENQRNIIEGQFNAVVVTRQKLIANLLQDAEDPKLPTALKLAVETRLHMMQEALGSRLGAGTGQVADDAKTYLEEIVGMKLRPSHGRITQTSHTVVEFGEELDPELRKSIDVIDVVPDS